MHGLDMELRWTTRLALVLLLLKIPQMSVVFVRVLHGENIDISRALNLHLRSPPNPPKDVFDEFLEATPCLACPSRNPSPKFAAQKLRRGLPAGPPFQGL